MAFESSSFVDVLPSFSYMLAESDSSLTGLEEPGVSGKRPGIWLDFSLCGRSVFVRADNSRPGLGEKVPKVFAPLGRESSLEWNPAPKRDSAEPFSSTGETSS